MPPGRIAVALLAVAFFFARVHRIMAAPEPVVGDVRIHDPSTIVTEGPVHHVFGTGQGIRVKTSTDLVHWTNAAPVFATPPAWTTNAVPGFAGHFWAPDVRRVGGRYLLYYSVSTFGKQTSAIGLATNPTLDPRSPDYHWTDRGPVVISRPGLPYNAIDPSVTTDAAGRLWMAFGSFWDGIFVTELDPKSGLRIATNAPVVRVAWNPSIEAACLHGRGQDFYLFVNWGACCRGTNSTYVVRVGRAASPTGPFLDRNGVDLVRQGGTLFMKTSHDRIGPGHIGIPAGGDDDWFSYHYYDGAAKGAPTLGIGRMKWSDDGWPVFADGN